MGKHIRMVREALGDCSLEKLLAVSRRRPLVIVIRKIVDRASGTVLVAYGHLSEQLTTKLLRFAQNRNLRNCLSDCYPRRVSCVQKGFNFLCQK